MSEIMIKAECEASISDAELLRAIKQSIEVAKHRLKKVLLLPPDFTRMHSGAGKITALYYEILKDTCKVDIMPALGTHEPMSRQEWTAFFGERVPMDCMVVHNWRNDVVKIGEVPGEYISNISEGLVNEPINVEVNKRLLDKTYNLIISIGQVVPHEVVGMANYSKKKCYNNYTDWYSKNYSRNYSHIVSYSTCYGHNSIHNNS